jgi:thiol-disulfide isomerase/thioredoxin
MKKILQKVACVTALISIGFNAQAQLPDNGIWPSGVTFTDINGNVHDIDAMLDAGKPVFIDAFADWCAPCWSYHQTHALENLSATYGPSGTDELFVIGVESDPNQPEANITNPNTGEGDWSDGITYPLADDDNLAEIINQKYYPTIIMICPDRTVTEVGQQNTSPLYNASAGCGAPISDANDAQVLSYTGDNSTCDQVELSVLIQNFGSNNLTSATVSAYDGGAQVATTNWTGNLAPYEVEEVIVGNVSPSGNTTYSIEIDDNDDDVSNNVLSQAISEAPTSSNIILVEVTTDYYPGETSWEIRDENNVVIESDSYQDGPEAYGGGGPDATMTHEYNIDLGSSGCYTFILIDSRGNGMIYTGGTSVANFGVVITSDGGAQMADIDGDTFEYQADSKFQSDGTASLKESVSEIGLNVYPNPATSVANVSFNNESASETTITLTNSLGQVVYEENLGAVSGNQNVQINTAELNSGIYTVTVASDYAQTNSQLSIID